MGIETNRLGVTTQKETPFKISKKRLTRPNMYFKEINDWLKSDESVDRSGIVKLMPSEYGWVSNIHSRKGTSNLNRFQYRTILDSFGVLRQPLSSELLKTLENFHHPSMTDFEKSVSEFEAIIEKLTKSKATPVPDKAEQDSSDDDEESLGCRAKRLKAVKLP